MLVDSVATLDAVVSPIMNAGNMIFNRLSGERFVRQPVRSSIMTEYMSMRPIPMHSGFHRFRSSAAFPSQISEVSSVNTNTGISEHTAPVAFCRTQALSSMTLLIRYVFSPNVRRTIPINTDITMICMELPVENGVIGSFGSMSKSILDIC